MTNKKFKKVSDSIKIQQALITGTRNLMTVYCCLHQMGVSRKKILEIDDILLTKYVKECKRDATADVLATKAHRFLNEVGVEWKDVIDVTTAISLPYLADKKYERNALLSIIESLSEDMTMYLKLLNYEIGYGKKRLVRVLTAVKDYKGDALTEAAETFGFDYGDMTALPTIDRSKKPMIDKETADKLRKVMAVG